MPVMERVVAFVLPPFDVAESVGRDCRRSRHPCIQGRPARPCIPDAIFDAHGNIADSPMVSGDLPLEFVKARIESNQLQNRDRRKYFNQSCRNRDLRAAISGVRTQVVAFARMRVASGRTGPARLGATLAVRMLMLVALIGAGPAQVRAQRAEIAVMGGLARQHADRRLAEGCAVERQQATRLHQAVTRTDAGVGALTRREQGFRAGLHASLQVFGGAGHGKSFLGGGAVSWQPPCLARPATGQRP